MKQLFFYSVVSFLGLLGLIGLILKLIEAQEEIFKVYPDDTNHDFYGMAYMLGLVTVVYVIIFICCFVDQYQNLKK
jgi:hypothetical protein